MPIYEYECLECGAHFDMRQSVGDPPPATCPNGHPAVHRRLSAPAIIFKGSGFYVTDHGRNGQSASSGGKSHHVGESKEKADSWTSEKTSDKSGAGDD